MGSNVSSNKITALASDSSPNNHAKQPDATAHPAVACPLCCEEHSSSTSTNDIFFLSCRHQSCRACLAKWIERTEASGQTTPPACPFCRSTIGEVEVRAILGRPFEPRGPVPDEPNRGDEIDELTLEWINENTVPCRACVSAIEKESGCDLVECLCGYRFCYRCGAAGGRCGCNPGHTFPDGTLAADGGVDRDLESAIGLCEREEREREEEQERERPTDRTVLNPYSCPSGLDMLGLSAGLVDQGSSGSSFNPDNHFVGILGSTGLLDNTSFLGGSDSDEEWGQFL